MNSLLDQALAYAAAGWPVFPCQPNNPGCRDSKCRRCKVPVIAAAHPLGDPLRVTCRRACGRDGHGCHDATTDPARITAWWRRWPTANIAIATGHPGPDVLDVDVKPDGTGFPALGRLKLAGLLTGATRLVRTRSGGCHVYFTGTAGECHALPRHHLDFKAAGGYILAPPSVVHGQPYTLVDHRPGTAVLDWAAVSRLLDPPQQAPRRTVAPRWHGTELPPLVRWALTAPAEDRSRALHRLVGACVRAGLDEDRIHEVAGHYQPALEKYGQRLPTEIERSLRRIGAA